jgi:hypothetical protein
MANPFEIIVRFLDRFGDEVGGRELQDPPPEIQAMLSGLARGKIPPERRADLFDLLNRNPGWLARLAEEIKATRPHRGTEDHEQIA